MDERSWEVNRILRRYVRAQEELLTLLEKYNVSEADRRAIIRHAGTVRVTQTFMEEMDTAFFGAAIY